MFIQQRQQSLECSGASLVWVGKGKDNVLLSRIASILRMTLGKEVVTEPCSYGELCLDNHTLIVIVRAA
jgi:hypothetical protein